MCAVERVKAREQYTSAKKKKKERTSENIDEGIKCRKFRLNINDDVESARIKEKHIFSFVRRELVFHLDERKKKS